MRNSSSSRYEVRRIKGSLQPRWTSSIGGVPAGKRRPMSRMPSAFPTCRPVFVGRQSPASTRSRRARSSSKCVCSVKACSSRCGDAAHSTAAWRAKSTWLPRSARPRSRHSPASTTYWCATSGSAGETGSRGSIVVRERGLGTLTVQRDLSASVRPRIDLDSPAYASSGEQPHYRFQWNTTRATN